MSFRAKEFGIDMASFRAAIRVYKLVVSRLGRLGSSLMLNRAEEVQVLGLCSMH